MSAKDQTNRPMENSQKQAAAAACIGRLFAKPMLVGLIDFMEAEHKAGTEPSLVEVIIANQIGKILGGYVGLELAGAPMSMEDMKKGARLTAEPFMRGFVDGMVQLADEAEKLRKARGRP